ncbi:trypsin alpha-3-like [Culicoides brevitarsis]|uniref:trypsin alpha-3-like n=1 Tax=Culicoides brevitarsis TaxID=469753 RepID=UPI00307C7AB6
MSHTIFLLVLIYATFASASLLLQLPKETNFIPDLRIVGGRPANQSDTKHQVSLRLKSREVLNGFGYGHICGGSLIAPDLVLTAAHCMYKDKSNTLRRASEFHVVMGTMNVTVKTSDTLVYTVKKFVVHKRYSSKTVQNDIALIKLSEAVSVNHTKVQPIQMIKREITAGTKCQITGWGAMKNEGSGVFYLQTADIQIQDITKCNSSSSYNGLLKPGMLCAGYFQGGTDSCQGDSGGPLVCNGELTGVISWGFKCALPNFPGIYSDIYYFRDWIETNSGITMSINSMLIMTIAFIMTLLI